jgi:hyperosmotically inducible protein
MPVAVRNDEEIEKNIMEQLYWDDRVDASDLKVEVSGGEVILKGTVPSCAAYQAAEDDAWSMPGVKYVRNDAAVKYPSGAKVPSDAEIKASIESVLLWQPDIDSLDIDVSVENESVVLRGSVDAYWKKVRAEELALALSGVSSIKNELAVVPSGAFTDKAIADDIESALKRNVGADVDSIDVRVENGKVTLSGSVSSLAALSAAEKIVENTPGVILFNRELVVR